MTDIEVEQLLAEVARGTVKPRTALALLVGKGEVQTKASRMIFQALGGSDQTELDAHGRLRYVGSGKLVADVERAIAGDSGA